MTLWHRLAGQPSFTLQSPGHKTYRVLIDGGPINASGHSSPVTIAVYPPASPGPASD